MKIPLQVVVFLPFFLISVQCLKCSDDCQSIEVSRNTSAHYRPKRYLDFIQRSRVFYRTNIKENVFTWGNIWAHASGFKQNINILNSNKALRPVYRRDTYEVLQQMMELHGFDGKACMLKAFCTATRTADGEYSNGMLFKLLRHIFKLDEHDKRHFSYLKEENCDQIMHHHCPLSFNNISPYTDDI